MSAGVSQLVRIPVIDTGPSFPRQSLAGALDGAIERAHALLDGATGRVPGHVLRLLDRASRRWLVRQRNPYLAEIDEVAALIGRPGCHFLSVNYEWGCSVSVGRSPAGGSAQLVRTLDWLTPGLGRYVVAARVAGEVGPFVTLTWPGFVGVLQAMAPGRFAASINQAPMRRAGGGLFVADWMASKARVWRNPHLPPILLLRRIMEQARDFEEARRLMIETPLAAPVSFALAGLGPRETCVVERSEERAFVIDGPACVTNHWLGLDHGAHGRGIDSEGRLEAISKVGPVEPSPTFDWLRAPVLNGLTRLAMVADASAGRLVAQGFEDGAPVTHPLDLTVARSGAGSGGVAAAQG
jgi:hypothetical protein